MQAYWREISRYTRQWIGTTVQNYAAFAKSAALFHGDKPLSSSFIRPGPYKVITSCKLRVHIKEIVKPK
jgi:hypothetical protein